MIDRVQWPGPPFRLTPVVGCAGWVLRIVALLLWPMGAGFILFALLLASGHSGPLLGARIEDRAFAPIWIPVAIAAIGLYCLWVARHGRRLANEQVRMAQHPEQLALVDADLLCLRHGHRGIFVWTYAYSWRGRRCFHRQPMLIDPLMLDDLGSRGAAAVMPDGSSLLLGNKAHPLKMDKATRRRLLAEVAALAARRTSPGGGELAELAARLEGPRRDYVHLYRDACREADPERRREIVRRRLLRVHKEDPDEIDRLLRACRRHAAGQY